MANFNIDYLVVGAGGGGGSANGASGSGGGAGEYLYQTGQTISTGTAYTVDVGINGVGGATPGSGQNGTSGVDSSFNNYIARGGGFGVVPNLPGNGGDGGSGGGANYPYYSPGSSTAVSPGLGNNGGAGSTVSGGAGAYGSGGGGGAAQAGFPGTSSVAGNGGDGIYNSITGTSTAYAAGGGGGIFAPSGQYTFGIGGSGGTGGSSSITNNASDGAPSTGSGGGGGSYSASTVPYNGGNGAQGIVILRWLTTDASYTVSGANPTETIDGAYTVLSFTAVVTSTITFNSTATTKISSALVDFNSGTEDGLKLPSGDDANQPTGVGGMIRNNTDSGMSFYNGTEWITFETESVAVVLYNNVLYTGNGGVQNNIAVGFEPDFVWFKARTLADNHALLNSVVGDDKVLYSNLTTSEGNWGGANNTVDFTTNGFSLKRNKSETNLNGINYVAWCFKAGGAAVANTDGTVASQVSANVAGGFSIVKYTGSALIGNTVGHGLSSSPEMIIQKASSTTRNWNVFNYLITGNLHLNLADAANTSEYWAVNGNTFAIQDQSASEDRIAYCFHSVAGVSKVGSYTGNGSSTGTIITLDFAPSFVMIKGTDQTSDWIIIDNKRDTTNPNSARLDANSASAEYNGENIMDLNSNGFQLKTASASKNGLNKVFIYMAFAT